MSQSGSLGSYRARGSIGHKGLKSSSGFRCSKWFNGYSGIISFLKGLNGSENLSRLVSALTVLKVLEGSAEL